MSNKRLKRNKAIQHWRLLGTVGFALGGSCFYHAGLLKAVTSGVIAMTLLAAALGIGAGAVLLRHSISGLGTTTSRYAVWVIAGFSILLAVPVVTGLHKSPAIYWQFDDDPHTWRPVIPYPQLTWGDKKSVIALHPLDRGSGADDRSRNSSVAADISKVFPGHNKRFYFSVTQPEEGLVQTQPGRFAEQGLVDKDTLLFQVKRGEQWETLERIHLDLANQPEERYWHAVMVNVPADSEQMRVEATSSDDGNTARHTVWISSDKVCVAGGWVFLIPLFVLTDFISVAFIAGCTLCLLAYCMCRIVGAGYFALDNRQTRTNPASLLTGLLLCLVVILPALAWVFIDKSPFGGDGSQYASATLDLYRSWMLTPWLWAKAMISSLGFKTPGIAWLGQWFVPLGSVLGSVDTALLLSIVATQVVTLLLVFRTLWTLSQGSNLVSLAGCLFLAGGPLFQSLSHHYLVEPLQLLAVAWFVLIMSHAPRWNRAFTLAQLVTATAVAMLAKVSSPLYCIGPALVALGFILGILPSKTPWGWKHPLTVLAWIAAIPLSIGTVCWYYQNIAQVMSHVAMATTGPIAAVWGKEDTFFNSFVYWLDTTLKSFFLTPALILGTIIVASGLVCYLLRPDQRKKYFTLCCAIAVLQIALVLVAFSFGSNREPRYLLALLPYVALIVGWGISHISKPIVSVCANSVLVFIWAATAGYSLHLFDLNLHVFAPISRADTSTKQAAIMQEIVARTCAETSQTPYYNIIAIDPSLKGDWLAPAPANYVAARDYLYSQSVAPCSYGYLGDGFFGNDAADSWISILAKRPLYIVTFDPSIYSPSGRVYNQALNEHNFTIIFEKLKTGGRFELLSPLSEDPGILIFRESAQLSSGVATTSVASAQSAKPSVNIKKTQVLFSYIYGKELGDTHGVVEMRDAGILLHPGTKRPTRVSFDITGKYETVTLTSFIATLPPQALEMKDAGTVGIEFFVDGVSIGRATINRYANYEKTLNLRGAKTLSINVDNSDGKPWYDWLILAVK